MVERQKTSQLLLIQAGGALCLPVMMVGQLLTYSYGWISALFVIAIGNLLLMALSLLFVGISSKTSQTTPERATHYFGGKGKLFFALLMISTTLGWFSIQLNFITRSLSTFFSELGISMPASVVNVLIGFSITLLLSKGARAVRFIATLCTPLVGGMLVYVLATTQSALRPCHGFNFDSIKAISIVIGCCISVVIDTPTFFRHAKTVRSARIVVIALFGAVVPLIQGVGVYLAAHSSENSNLLHLLYSGRSKIELIIICLLVFLCGWTTNNNNLYSATSAFGSLKKKSLRRSKSYLLGFLATAFALFDPASFAPAYLTILGIVKAGVGGVLISGYLGERRSIAPNALFAFSALVLSIVLAPYINLSQIVALDAFILAFLFNTSSVVFLLVRRKYALPR